MPSLEQMDRNQWALWWDPVGVDEHNRRTFRPPAAFRVRWVQKRRELTNAQGDTLVTDGTVVLGRDIPVGSLLWLGEEADWYGTGSNNEDDRVMEVISVDKTPDLKGRVTRYEATVMRYTDTITTG